MKKLVHLRLVLFRSAIALVLFTDFFTVNAQTFEVTSFYGNGQGSVYVMIDCDPPNPAYVSSDSYNTIPTYYTGSWFGTDYDYSMREIIKDEVFCQGIFGLPWAGVNAYTGSTNFITGDSTDLLSFSFYSWVHVYKYGDVANYQATGQNSHFVNSSIMIMPGGGYDWGDQVTLYSQYVITATAATIHESAFEDPVTNIDTFNYNIGGSNILNFDINVVDPPRTRNFWFFENDTLTVDIGDTVTLELSSLLSAEINPPAHWLSLKDRAKSRIDGYVILSFQPIPLPPQYQPGYNPRIEFSLDIGADAELSDPNQNGNEAFDPGDAYVMGGPFMPSPQNGVRDDAAIFGIDPWPVPGDTTTNVPCGNDNFDPLPYFNLNGMDIMESSLFGMSYGPMPPYISIPWFSDELVFLAQYFLISYDDDGPENWAYQWGFPGGSVPVNSFSPMSGQTFGRTNAADEVIAVDLDPYFIPSAPFTLDSLWSEADIHPNLAPNPDTLLEYDNDVNALNYFPNQDIDGYFYFTCNSEATYTHPATGNPLNPGSIYQLISPGNFVEVINPVTHLGLPNGTDVNAFAFGWVWDTLANRLGLTLLFSVDMNDWTTPLDESGGLNPAMIYYSFLNGTNAPYMFAPLSDNIDAITIVPYSYNPFELDPPAPDLYDYGDAPEGDSAYPNLGTIGNFPTCTAVGPIGSFIRHAGSGELFFGPSVDYEGDGNAGLCPTFSPDLYDQDECWNDGDAGLLLPVPYTIVEQAGIITIQLCDTTATSIPWKSCREAIWGMSVDIFVTNTLPDTAYFNLLVDWNQDGQWGGGFNCPLGSGAEHAVVNFPVPPGFADSLSKLTPPNFRIGPNEGHVWARFTISEQAVVIPWNGTGDFSFGETEDYLLAVADPNMSEYIEFDGIVIPGGSDFCFEAEVSISMTNATIDSCAKVTLIAGHSIHIYPNTHIKYGAKFLATIDNNGNFCSNYKSIVTIDEETPQAELPAELVDSKAMFSVFPNPTPGHFTLELSDIEDASIIVAEIYSILGERILKQELPAMQQCQFDLSNHQPGIYLIRVTMGDKVGVEKIIKQ